MSFPPTLRLIYLVFGTVALYWLGLLSCAAGHGPFTFLEAIGSWFSVLLQVVFGVDTWLLGGVLWAQYTNNADAMLLGNIGMACAPVGFLAYYGGMKWSVRRCCGRNAYRLQLVLHMAGSFVAIAWGMLSRINSGSVTTDLAFGIAGAVVGGLFVEGDLLLQRLA